MEGIFLSSASYLLLAALALVVLALVADWCRKNKDSNDNKAPGPKPWPIIGSLHLLGGYQIPYQAFDNLANKYGPIFSITLGEVPCLVVSGLDLVKEVLLAKGDHFDGRPNFRRFQLLFNGDKENSLAFCDWSEMQKTRREMLKVHTFPRAFTTRFHLLDSLLKEEITAMTEKLSVEVTDFKPLLLQACANIFTSYFCSVKFSRDDPHFIDLVKNFDKIFYEVNQGCAADFLPWLLPLQKNHLNNMAKWSHEVREFMVSRIISKRIESWKPGQEGKDYVDALIEHVNREKTDMTMETALFALEDIVGGHSAVANLVVKVLGFVAGRPDIQKCVQDEIDAVCAQSEVTLSHRMHMPYTEAVILEAMRHISSPIVPHVANQQTTVQGYTVDKGTLIFLNNYTLNMSPELWSQPEQFAPERFLSSEGKLTKPEHFLPFGGGRRSCMGYKMTQYVSFFTLATLLQRYHVSPASEDSTIPLGNLALPYETIKFRFHPR